MKIRQILCWWCQLVCNTHTHTHTFITHWQMCMGYNKYILKHQVISNITSEWKKVNSNQYLVIFFIDDDDFGHTHITLSSSI